MDRMGFVILITTLVAGICQAYNASEGTTFVGPYSSAMENANPLSADAGIPGFIGPSGRGGFSADPNETVINPVFIAWATGYFNYIPAPAADPDLIGNEQNVFYGGVPSQWRTPWNTIGALMGDNPSLCSLGDLWQIQLDVLNPDHPDYAANQAMAFDNPYKIQPGQITLIFDAPIQNGPGPDFAIFENGHISAGGDGLAGQIFAELAFVEVSTDGVTFVRFPSVSLTPQQVGPYGTIDPSNVYNLAGKHVNAYQQSWGTPFNLSDLANTPQVLNGEVDLDNVNFIRIVDIPGSGFFNDAAALLIDPATIDPDTGLGGTPYAQNHSIYDAWVTWGSGGFDLDAVGVIEQIYGDANSDGRVDMQDFLRLALRWKSHGNWPQGDFDENGFIDEYDLLLLGSNWLFEVERYPQ